MHYVLIFFLKCWAQVFGCLPRKAQLFFGNLLGRVLYFTRVKGRVVDNNLKIYFNYIKNSSKQLPHVHPFYPLHSGEPLLLDEAARSRRLKVELYRGFGNLVLEVLLLFGPFQKFIKKNVEIKNFQIIQKARAGGRGIILLSSHVGNWEVMAAAAGVLVDIDLMLVTKRLKPAWLHREVEKARLRCGVKGTYEPRTLKDILAHLKRGGSVGLVLDQYVGAPVGIRVPFFGVPVGTAYGVAAIAKRTGATVIPVENYRLATGRWMVEVGEPLSWVSHSDSNHELALNTLEYSREMERQVLKHPEQWLWFHRRFKGDLTPLRQGEWEQARLRK